MTGNRVVAGVLSAVCVAIGLAWFVTYAHSQPTGNSAAERRAQIQACLEHGGIPVPIAGIIASQGIGCAQPVGGP